MNQALVPPLTAIALLVASSDNARAQVAAAPGLDAPPAPFSTTFRLGAPGAPQSDEVTWWDRSRADSIPPAGVDFARPVAKGQWMVRYSYERQNLDGLRSGRDDLSTDALFAAGFDTLPTEARFQTHDLEIQHGIAENWTLFASVPYVDKEMLNWASGTEGFTTRASGIGDVLVGGIYDVRAGDGDLVRFNLGLSIPTGDVEARDADENGNSFLLPYTMQLGTGTHDLLPGVTLVVQESSWSWGLQAQGRFHLDTNTQGWAWGRRLSASAWAAKGWTRQLSTSLRLEGLFWSDIHGAAAEADPTRNPLENNTTQGGDRIDVAGGLQWLVGDGAGLGNLLTAEAAFPVDEWLKGPQLSTDWTLFLGWQLSF